MIQLTKNKKFIISLLIPLFILLGMTVKPLLTTFYGEKIYLQTVPIDPRDLFYGDYVTLQFEIEELPLKIVEPEVQKHLDLEGNSYTRYKPQPVYISLEYNAKERVHKGVKVTKSNPNTPYYIKGKIASYVSSGDSESSERKVHVTIPIERYYLEENTGKQLEEESRQGKLKAEIKVKNGYPILQNITPSKN